MNRGMDGVMPRTPRLEDESYLDIMQSVRNFAIREMFPQVAQQAEAGHAQTGETGQQPVSTLAAVWKRLMRSQQQRTWTKIADSVAAEAPTFKRELEAAETQRPGRLTYRSDFVVPRYAAHPIHLQPGGYVGDPLAGLVFHHGTRVFYQGQNDQDELHRGVAASLALPADGKVLRVLDLGCSIGQCTTAIKLLQPQAEVHGMDVSLPLLRYAHRRATDLGIDVHFTQGLAEQTGFADRQFDAVLTYILFHEVPQPLFLPILREIHRVLRPGGTLTIVDAPNDPQLPAGNRLWLEFDARYNCEPYSPAFVACDLPNLLRQAGFESVQSGPTPSFLTRTTAVRPAG